MVGLSTYGAVSVLDHYERLKISRDAPLEVIRAAYRALAAKHHPDRHGQSEGANTDMAALNAAYEVLCDPQARAAYDAILIKPGRAGASHDSTEPSQGRTGRSRSGRASADAPRPSVHMEHPDVDWSALISAKPQINPWTTRQRLIPIVVVAGLLAGGAAVWLSRDAAEQVAEERLLAEHFKTANPTRDLAAEAMAQSNRAVAANNMPVDILRESMVASGASAGARAVLPPVVQTPEAVRSKLASLRHPLDGEGLLLKREGQLVDPLAKP
jgi:curved DNA-binding protein CbpA